MLWLVAACLALPFLCVVIEVVPIQPVQCKVENLHEDIILSFV